MGGLDPKALIDVARSYDRLRRRCLWFDFGQMGSFLAFALLFGAAVALKANPVVPSLLFLFFIPVFFFLVVVGYLPTFELRAFRCPRCGKRFAMASRFFSFPWDHWPTNRCKHCRLDLGPMLIDAETPTSAEALWE